MSFSGFVPEADTERRVATLASVARAVLSRAGPTTRVQLLHRCSSAVLQFYAMAELGALFTATIIDHDSLFHIATH